MNLPTHVTVITTKNKTYDIRTSTEPFTYDVIANNILVANIVVSTTYISCTANKYDDNFYMVLNSTEEIIDRDIFKYFYILVTAVDSYLNIDE
jgi:hypothetical protein